MPLWLFVMGVGAVGRTDGDGQGASDARYWEAAVTSPEPRLGCKSRTQVQTVSYRHSEALPVPHSCGVQRESMFCGPGDVMAETM